ncbi:hypothetical protein EVAR_53337_1 [Eumeta japonica]|uniref:Uncharacterized protein n=1 Tax=Eumeta variegata TaxID=151549 RepID=A0A4C1X7N9_EUMVA|nr:hypothetical protein EVAR_53337_1 [Eumeta japonica]
MGMEIESEVWTATADDIDIARDNNGTNSIFTRVNPLARAMAVYISGVVAVVGVTALGVLCLLSVLQLAMLASRERVAVNYPTLLMIKLALALLATLLSIASAGLFAVQGDDRGFVIRRAEAFYVQIVCIVINAALFIMSLYDVLLARRDGGDPTAPAGAPRSTTINNPGFKDGRGISMTDSSGKPYSTNGHGSVASMNTTATTLTAGSDASTITRSPLRSSLKKPRDPAGLGIQNPGYSGHSPPLNRNGSQKKVRIQTHSTEHVQYNTRSSAAVKLVTKASQWRKIGKRERRS